MQLNPWKRGLQKLRGGTKRLDIASVPNFLKQFVQLDSQVNEYRQ